jgi:hypothetical protein
MRVFSTPRLSGGHAIHVKLNELGAAVAGASNRLFRIGRGNAHGAGPRLALVPQAARRHGDEVRSASHPDIGGCVIVTLRAADSPV